MILSYRTRLTAFLLAGGFLVAGAVPALAAVSAHTHSGAAATQPAPGQKWPADPALREGMTRIRAAFAPRVNALHGDKLTQRQYKQMAAEAEIQVAHIVANCKLPPDADAALHVLLGEIGEGTQAMQGNSSISAHDGAIKIVAALDAYGRAFDHPGWKALDR